MNNAIHVVCEKCDWHGKYSSNIRREEAVCPNCKEINTLSFDGDAYRAESVTLYTESNDG